jgi:recombinational DNA repair protein RecR
LKQVKQLPQLLAKIPNLTLAAAYRNKKELSEHDKKLLDDVARNIENRKKNVKPGGRAKASV